MGISNCLKFLVLSVTTLASIILIILLRKQYICGCFVCMYVCAAHACLLALETGRRHWIHLELQNAGNHYVGAWIWTQVIRRCNKCLWPPIYLSQLLNSRPYLLLAEQEFASSNLISIPSSWKWSHFHSVFLLYGNYRGKGCLPSFCVLCFLLITVSLWGYISWCFHSKY